MSKRAADSVPEDAMKCRKCSADAAPGKKSCSSCLVRKREQNKRRRRNFISQKRCSSCGGSPPVAGKKSCQQCLNRLKGKVKSNNKARRKAGQCVVCATPTTRRLCDTCQGKKVISEKRRRATLRANGKCVWCTGSRDTDHETLCSECCFIGAARAWLGGAKDVGLLKQLLEDQHHVCPYTGYELVVGQNASVDHKVPRSRGGSLDLSNLQWVDAHINRVKTDMTHEEFLDLCHLIAARYPR